MRCLVSREHPRAPPLTTACMQTSSSIAKGETLQDTVRCLECYADVLVLRHPVKGSAKAAAGATSKPLLNAGT